MRGTSTRSRWWSTAFALTLSACGAADNRVDPGDLALRDLLGVAPEVAAGWDAVQRASARRVLATGLDEDSAATRLALAAGRGPSERLARTLAVLDADRAAAGAEALGLVRVALAAGELAATGRAAPMTLAAAGGDDTATAELWLADGWDAAPAWGHLPGRGLDVLAALAIDADHAGGPVVVAPGPRLAAIAAYVDGADGRPELVVNPVLLAALEPDPLEATTAAALGRATGPALAEPEPVQAEAGLAGAVPTVIATTGGNPYSFYGSVAECAYAQRTRCEACLPGSTCAPVTDIADGNAECTMLGAGDGRGYFLLCINLALTISSVDRCVADEAPSCPRDVDAASSLARLESNARFLDETACGVGLDLCLADIYGDSGGTFPGPGPDGGTASEPPRNTTVSCGDSCDDSNNNCEASPSCNATGPSCNNSLSCDSACSSSNEQSGCGGNCASCESSDDSGSTGGSGCGSDSDGSTGSSGSCDSCSSDSSGGGSCDSCSSDSGSSGGGGSCDSCSSSSGGSSGGGSCGSGSGGGSCGGGSGGGSGSSSCNVARRGPPASVTLMIAAMWGLLPLPAAALVRRRARRRKAGAAAPVAGDEEVAS